ncbi:hypothetical protein AcW1_005388 [Taiwanofungus camphoratus]|nr:hypothetical protein AcW2_004154 [Antrodia cinnamomea]KAI0933602.1 hypothetical protein AcV5_005706 [Antrodia cinnamomea]KAI0948607.1 hypothetical protein AcV7_009300 [Antrodia cinnamomea]KAI0956792.1 hypothetical protein AcW1_005388 [Antrodia cinnamomea]
MLIKIAAAFALVSLAAIPVARGAEYQVTVGGPGVLKYNPQFVTANPGDTVVFSFRQKNHTATQSTFENPCELADGGFDSGFIPVSDNNTNGPFPAAQFTVEDTNPVWVFCRQADHCQQGMVFAINPGNQFSTFQAAAMGNTTTNSSTSSSVASATASSSATVSSSIPASSSVGSTPASATVSPSASVVTVTATVTASGSQEITTDASSASSAPPSISTSSDHIVVVGGPNKLYYDPANITAEVGDTVTFRFMQKNHTVTESSFADPCVSLTQTSTNGEVGFDSGFMPVADNATSFPTFTIQINNTAPIWAFCRQTGHCGAGMVFSVNAIESGPNNFAAFQAKAKQLNGTTSDTATTNGTRVTTVGRGAGAVATIIAIITALFL